MGEVIAGRSTAPVKPRRRWWRILVWSAATFLVLIVGLFLLATNSAVFKRVVLPRIGKAMNATITVEDATIRPFSRISLRQLKIQTTGGEPLAVVPLFEAQYRLGRILRGDLHIENITIDSPRIHVVENADGSSNLDPLVKSERSTGPDKSGSSKSELSLRHFQLKNGSIRQTRQHADGTSEVVELTNVNAEIAGLQVGQTGKITFNADVRTARDGAGPTNTPEALTGKISSDLQIALGKAMAPETIAGSITIKAGTLDFTPYYNLVAGRPPPPKTASGDPKKSEPNPAPPTEPAAVQLPFRGLTVDLNIGRAYLRQLAITNWQMKAILNGGKVELNPLSLGLNGAPIHAQGTVDLSVPGYRYDLAFKGTAIPLGPLMNTFQPNQTGQYQGVLTINSQIRGAGITGANLQKNLGGEFDLTFTNAQIRWLGPKLKRFLAPVAALLQVPELIDSPVSGVTASARVGQGKIDCNVLRLNSPVFMLDTSGQLPISETLTNSPFQKWPVNFYLRGSVASAIRFVSGKSGGDYVKLPNFLHVGGTLGNPKAEIDKSALAGSVLSGLADRIPGLDEKAGNLLKGVGNVLSKDGGSRTNAAGTNAPSTGGKLNPLDLFKKKK